MNVTVNIYYLFLASLRGFKFTHSKCNRVLTQFFLTLLFEGPLWRFHRQMVIGRIVKAPSYVVKRAAAMMKCDVVDGIITMTMGY